MDLDRLYCWGVLLVVGVNVWNLIELVCIGASR
jgi:hypothetical protein